MRIPVALDRVAQLGLTLGVHDLNKLSGCWEHQIDAKWWIALNPHRQKTRCSHGSDVPPFTLYVEFNGWPAGFVNAGGGVIAAGKLANEDAFITAIDSAIEALNGTLQ